MKIKLEQLRQQLQQQLKPVYIVTGDECLLVDKACHYINTIAKQQGFQERKLIQATATFNWHEVRYAQQATSLFSEKCVIELHLPTDKLNNVGSASLLAYADNPPVKKLLLLRLPKLSTKAQKSKWFTALATIGVVITIDQVTAEQFPTWIKRYLAKAKLHVSDSGVDMLANLSAGNLLAAKQAIAKLSLLYGEGELSVTQIAACLNDNAHYNIYALLDSILVLDIGQSINILNKLKATGTAAPLILWVLTKEIRILAQLAQATINGTTWQQYGIWSRRQSLLRRHLQVMHYRDYLQLLQSAAQCDLLIKGVIKGDIWQALQQLLSLIHI